MSLPKIWGGLVLAALVASCGLAPAGDWSYALGGGFRVVRGPSSTAPRNVAHLLFPKGRFGADDLATRPSVEDVQVLAENDAAIVGKAGAIRTSGESATTAGWFVIQRGPARLEVFPDEAAWSRRAAQVYPEFQANLFPGDGGFRNPAQVVGVLAGYLLLTWPLVTVGTWLWRRRHPESTPES